MNEFYEIDSTRVSHREYWWGTKSPLVVLGWLLKWLRVRIPSSSDDPNVSSTLPFVAEALPAEIAARFEPLAAELTGMGFGEPVYHVIHDPGTSTTVYWATFRHASGRHLARIHQRIWHQTAKADRGLFPSFLTAFADGTFLVSSAGKPDMAAPATVQMNRMHRASVASLWAAHERRSQAACERNMISPVNHRQDLLEASESLHRLVRDFHLERGVFRPRTSSEQARAEAFTTTVAQGRADGLEHPEVLAELDRLQEQKPTWSSAVWVLVLSLVAFLAVGAARWDWKFTLWLIPVMLLHESGHWVVMRLCRYRNLKMFFIPFFGAAVIGQNWNVAGWKKALVSLAGPVPGIAIGTLLGVLGLVVQQAWLSQGALMLLFVNGLNLLPFLPLDGGHVLQDILFCRHRWLDGAFRILAIFGLLGLGLLLHAWLLTCVAIPMAIALPVTFRLGRITDDLRREALPEPAPGEDRIPPASAQAILQAVRAAFPPKLGMSNKALAQHTLLIFERLNAKPPGVLASLALLAVHGGAFLTALVASGLLVIGQQGGLGFLSAFEDRPKSRWQSGDVEAWPSQPAGDPGAVHTRIVTTFANRAAAQAAFSSLTNRAAAAARLTRLGDSLVLALPAGDDAAREQWYAELQGRSTNLFVALSNAPVTASLLIMAPDKATATNVMRELKNYLNTGHWMRLIAPWSPSGRSAAFAPQRAAREEWAAIGRAVTKVGEDPALSEYGVKASAALKRGATAEAERLYAEQTRKREELESQALARWRAGARDSALVDLYAKLATTSFTNRVVRKSIYREVAGRLGEVPYEGHRPAPGAEAWSVSMGSVVGRGRMIRVYWLSFHDVSQGLPALAEWLESLGCRRIQYRLESGGLRADLQDEDDP